jgi:hypothetical protein
MELRAISALRIIDFDPKCALPEDDKRLFGELAYQITR